MAVDRLKMAKNSRYFMLTHACEQLKAQSQTEELLACRDPNGPHAARVCLRRPSSAPQNAVGRVRAKENFHREDLSSTR